MQYAMTSLIEYNGLDPEKALVQIRPREGEETIRTLDILKTIEDEGDSIAVVILSGIQYYTGRSSTVSTESFAGKQVHFP